MNAYELADYMDDNIDAYYASEQKHLDNAANMLRQQADYIAQLEKGLESSIALNKAQANRND